MKRSKMIEQIAEKLLHTNLYGGDIDEQEEARVATKMQRLRIAKCALEAVESLGMSPPKYSRDVVRTLDGDGLVMSPRHVNVRMWEPEEL